LLYRQLAGLFSFENTGGVDADQTVSVGHAAAIPHQAAGRDEFAVFEDRRHRVAEPRALFTQFQDVAAGDLDQFSNGKVEPVLWPPEFKTENMIYPCADAKK